MNQTYYTASIQYWSRGQLRGGISWSTKKCHEALTNLGYSPHPLNEHGTLIQVVEFQGTREEVLHHRRTITKRLKTLSSNKMAMRFDHTLQPGEHNGH